MARAPQGQPIRLLLKHANIDVAERRYSARSDGKGGCDAAAMCVPAAVT